MFPLLQKILGCAEAQKSLQLKITKQSQKYGQTFVDLFDNLKYYLQRLKQQQLHLNQ
jgi:hypothetical protein